MRKKTVMVIDDSEIVLEHFRMLLEGAGLEVKTVLDAGQSHHWQLLVDSAVDLILLDVMMPEVHGDLLLKMIREVSKQPVPTPVYLLSGLDEVELSRRAESAGAAGFISKNWSDESIVARVRQILELD